MTNEELADGHYAGFLERLADQFGIGRQGKQVRLSEKGRVKLREAARRLRDMPEGELKDHEAMEKLRSEPTAVLRRFGSGRWRFCGHDNSMADHADDPADAILSNPNANPDSAESEK